MFRCLSRAPHSTFSSFVHRCTSTTLPFRMLSDMAPPFYRTSKSGADPRNRTEMFRSSGGCMDHHCSVGEQFQEGRRARIELAPPGSQPSVQATTPTPPTIRLEESGRQEL